MIAQAAGLKQWPKYFNALRSSCEQDWKEDGHAEPTYCRWIGHGPKVSQDHYVSPLDTEFAQATG